MNRNANETFCLFLRCLMSLCFSIFIHITPIFSDTTHIIFAALFVNLCNICSTFLLSNFTKQLNSPFQVTGFFLHPMKTLENRCTGVLKFFGSMERERLMEN